MVNFNPETFEPYFRALVADPESDFELDEIDDALLQATTNSDDARACAYLAAEILSNVARPWSLAYALNTAIGASCMAGDTERVRRYLKQLVDLTIEYGTDLAAVSAAENVRRFLPGNATPDHVPNILSEVVRLYRHLGKVAEAIKILITAAYLFADFGAFQPAYGALSDAEDLARDNKLLQEYADVTSTLYSICLLEGDHGYAEKMWPTLQRTYAMLGQAVPTHLAVNRATLLFRTGDLADARVAFEDALAHIEPGEQSAEFRARILINLSACLRDIGEYALSDTHMAEARRLLSSFKEIDPELPLELELIASRNAVVKGELIEAVSCLNRAVMSLDAGVGLVEKLHYRRGLRERYIPRIEQLLVCLPSTGRADDVIPVIAATRANRVSDWLHFLSWAEMLGAKLSPDEKDELDGLVGRLAHYGSPHLFGYREKYDDPMSGLPRPDPWREISEYADKICARHGIERPFKSATAESISEIMLERLTEGYAVLVNMSAADGKMLLLIGDRYLFCDLPRAESKAFFEALLQHRRGPGQAKALGLAIGAYQEALLRSLATALSELAEESCKGVIFIPDGLNLTPINLVMVGHPGVRARMAAGKFDVRTCIGPYPTQREIVTLQSGLGIVETNSGLQYDKADVEGFFQRLGVSGTLLKDPTWETFAQEMTTADALVLSHHGASVGLFRDPYFANMAGADGSSAMDLMMLQGEAFRWPHRLAVLGTCHSGGLVNGNYQTQFDSHDLMGFPTVFLLNGRSEVMAASWAILDRFNVIFTALLAPELKKAHPSLAASTALAKLCELSKDELSDLVGSAFPADVPKTASLVDQIDNLRRQPFCYGAYQAYTLL
ncbi:MAG: tetratricopeptide repeat protein [Telluria sp.]